MLSHCLSHPQTRGLHLDSPETTERRRDIIRHKPFLRKIYQEWYQLLATALPTGSGRVLELGSGAGFLREVIPDLITSDVFPLDGVDQVIDATKLPFDDDSLRAVVMTNVFHHLAEPCVCLREAARCVHAGGRVLMIEPWHTHWSRFIYRWLHHEPFLPATPDWGFPGGGPLSAANGALPWIVFGRDQRRFGRLFPAWCIRKIHLLMPCRYLLSGGVSLRALMPGWSFGFWTRVESLFQPWSEKLAMFAFIVLEKRAHAFNSRAGAAN